MLALACSAFVLSAQGATPPARAHHSLAYDSEVGAVILTGGSTPRDSGRRFEFFNDLWAFDGARWTAYSPNGAALSGATLARHTRSGRLFSFGGYNGQSLGVLRTLENGHWRQLGENSELRVAEPGFAFDSRRQRFVAFGGSGRGSLNGDTWEFDGSRWMRLEVASPPRRQAFVMVFDSLRSRVVAFGGMGARAQPGQRPALYGDTWEFDGNRWTQRNAAGPSPRNGAGAAYDSRRGIVIVFGGVDSSGFRNDTWSWDGSSWKKLAESGPQPRGMGYLAYDPKRDRVVLFGGRKGWPDGDLNDTWEWDGRSWRRAAP
ncbi:MAG: hypothetical protein AB1762_16875 [Gemmatimonadota bacterium]